MSTEIVHLDVREDLKNERAPLAKIIQVVSGLSERQDLRLLAPFEPAPLFTILARQGFGHAARQLESGDWEVLFSRRLKVDPATGQSEAVSGCAESDLEVDARGLEPPQPLVTILDALATLPAQGRLKARTDRRPLHLYPQLEARGFTGQSQQQTDGSYLTIIRRSHQ